MEVFLEKVLPSGTVYASVVTGLFVFSIAFMAIAWIAKKNDGLALASVTGLICLLLIVFHIAPRTFGYGHVPSTVEDFSKRLDHGVLYATVWSRKESADNYVVMVKEHETGAFHAVRVKIEPPKDFVLIGGEPYGIVLNQK